MKMLSKTEKQCTQHPETLMQNDHSLNAADKIAVQENDIYVGVGLAVRDVPESSTVVSIAAVGSSTFGVMTAVVGDGGVGSGLVVSSNGDVRVEVITSGVVGDTESCIVDTDDRESEVSESVLVVEDADEEDNMLETVDDSTFVIIDVAAVVVESVITVVGDVEGTLIVTDIDMAESSATQICLLINVYILAWISSNAYILAWITFNTVKRYGRVSIIF